MPKIIGIDQSLRSTAWVEIDAFTGEIESLGLIKTKKNDEISKEERFLGIAESLMGLIREKKPFAVGIEGLSYNSSANATRDLAGLFYMILGEFLKENISYRIYPPLMVKAFAAGGRAGKEELFDAIPEKERKKILQTGAKKTTGLYDLSDAYHIASLLRSELAGEK